MAGAALAFVVSVSVFTLPQSDAYVQCPPGLTFPKFNYTLNASAKTVAIHVEPGAPVHADFLYKKWLQNNRTQINGRRSGRRVIVNPAVSQTHVLRVDYWLPCLCVEVYYTCTDSTRSLNCVLTKSGMLDVNDVWSSSAVKLQSNSLSMTYRCGFDATNAEISTALCWKHGRYCTVVFDLSLVKLKHEEYNLSAVDKHPHMCVKRSLRGNHNITCHFKSGMSSWMFDIDLRNRSIFININSTAPAKFSVQLCKLNQNTCASMGPIISLNTKLSIATIQLPVLSLEEKPCVQVWQSEPALYGRRIICPDYMRRRYGLYAVAVLVCVMSVTTMGICFHLLTNKGTAGWLYIQRPILLVCTSEDAIHISTVCSLASILQGELDATVHLALWGQRGTRVVDVGPQPWLYGQWDTVIKAQGIILIMWSLNAKMTYKQWWSERDCIKSSHQKDFTSLMHHKIEDSILTEKYETKKTGKHAAPTEAVSETCTVITPVFKAALTCLMGALQENKVQRVAFLSLHGSNGSHDIPKAFRGIPRYCLPHQFSGLLQELGVKTRRENSKFHCLTQLLSKVLSFWLAKQMSERFKATFRVI
ncbi:unnamed protein product [Knipowitschia caucasica]